MLCVNRYTPEQIENCRSRITNSVAAHRAVLAAGSPKGGPAFTAAARALEPAFFASLVVMLEATFMHRSRGLEGKDGNPLNEVRMLSHSILHQNGILTRDSTIKYDPAKSVLGIPLGGEIGLREPDFLRLLDAFLSDLQRKFA